MNYLESVKYELEQLDFWFKLNKNSQGSNEWNKNIDRGIELSEIIYNL